MSYETRYAAAMRQRSDRAASTPEAAEARKRLKQALKNAHADAAAKYPDTPTPESVGERMDYQQERIDHWRAELNA